ncbi:SPOR domain-containing protein [Vibrio aphrogenes]|uniref:SPOR domain-containing protein n=1 Tax=Vibrio aphrogenes TaxID=1891186 RepID=UPI000B35B72C|nr:SPOR domain-containing protein [Vibrio aphrogenes]
MKKIAIISLSALFLAACSSSDYDGEVAMETYQESYKTDDVPQPLTELSTAPLEQDVQSVTKAQTAKKGEVDKKVVKLSPATAESSESTVKVFYPNNKEATQPQSGHFLVQVIAVENQKNLLQTATDLPENQPKWENVKTVNNKQWHTLLFGDFKTSQEAKDAIMRLPARYQNMGPFVKSVDSITNSDFPTLKKLP